MKYSDILFITEIIICIILFLVIRKKGLQHRFFFAAFITFIALIIYTIIDLILLLIGKDDISEVFYIFRFVDYLLISLVLTFFVRMKKKQS